MPDASDVQCTGEVKSLVVVGCVRVTRVRTVQQGDQDSLEQPEQRADLVQQVRQVQSVLADPLDFQVCYTVDIFCS